MIAPCDTTVKKHSPSGETVVYVTSQGTVRVELGSYPYYACEIRVERDKLATELIAASKAFAAVANSFQKEAAEEIVAERPVWPRPESHRGGAQAQRFATRHILQPQRERATVRRNRRGRIET